MTTEGKIKQCTIVLTRECNLRCNFCYVKSAGYMAEDKISYENLKKIVDFCSESKVKFIFFTGGEPLLYPHLIDILQYIKGKQHSMMTAIATDGVLLKDSTLCKGLIDSGVEYLDLSIKGTNSQEWCKATGYDGFDQELQAIRNLSVLPVEFTCSMVVTHDNIFTICDAVKIAHDKGASQFSFTFVIDNDDIEEKDQVYLEKHNPFALVSAFISQIDRLNAITEDWWIEYSFPMCIYTEEQLSLLEGKLATPCQIHMKNAVTFNTKMELLPCDMYINQTMGQLGTDFSSYHEFEELTERPTYQCVMETLREQPSSECMACRHLESCYGGCPVLWKHYSFEALKAFKRETMTTH